MLKNRAITLLVGFSITLYARDNVYFPSFYSSYFFNKYQISPSYIPLEAKLECSGNYKSLLGELKKISAYSFSIARVFKHGERQNHAIRLSVYNEHEGSFISNPRGYLGYAFRQRLGQDLSLSAGAQLGATGVYYAAPTISQSSAILPDGFVAVGLIWKGFTLDLSMHHMFNTSKNILTSPLVLERYFHGYVAYQFDLNQDWQSKSYGLYRSLPYVQDEAYIATSLVYKELFTFGASVRYPSSLAFFAAFDLKNDRDCIQMFFNYNSAAFGLAPKWQNGMEIGLNYWMK